MWWKILAGVAGAALAVFLLVLFGEAREAQGRLAERVAAREAALVDERKASAKAIEAERRVTAAVDGYAARAAALRPIILTNTKEVMTYAASPAGAVRCRAADRVQSVDGLDDALFPPAPAPAPAGGD